MLQHIPAKATASNRDIGPPPHSPTHPGVVDVFAEQFAKFAKSIFIFSTNRVINPNRYEPGFNTE